MHDSGIVVGNKNFFFGDGPVRLIFQVPCIIVILQPKTRIYFFFSGDHVPIEFFFQFPCTIKVLYTVARFFFSVIGGRMDKRSFGLNRGRSLAFN